MGVLISENVLSTEVDGQTVLLEMETGQYFALDYIGTHIWMLLEKGEELSSIKLQLSHEFEVPLEQVDQDTELFIDHLISQGLASRV